MNSNNLHALIVLRNHAQAILNGARADLKLTREDKASLMNGLKKVDEVFIKNFENCVDASNVSTKVRSWTSTESEESVLSRAMGLEVAVAASDESAKVADSLSRLVDLAGDLPNEIKKDIVRAAELVGVLPKEKSLGPGLFSRVVSNVESSTAVGEKASETVTVPVVTTKENFSLSDRKTDKKTKRGPKKA